MMKRIATFILALLMISATQAQDTHIDFQETSWEEVKALAKEQQKPIFVDVFTDWCRPCKYMDKEVFTVEKVADFHNEHFINFHIDAEKGEGPDFAKEFKVQAFPTLLYFNAEGEVVHILVGGRQPDDFLAVSEAALDPDRQMVSLQKRWEAGERGKDFCRNLSLACKSGAQPFDDAFNAYFSAVPQEEWMDRDNWEFAFEHLYSFGKNELIHSDYFAYMSANKEAYSEAYGQDTIKYLLETQWDMALTEAGKKKEDAAEYEALKVRLRESDLENGERMIMYADMNGHYTRKEFREYIDLAGKYLELYGQESSNLLNNIAWTVMEVAKNDQDLENALAWVRKSIVLERASFNLDTEANILFQLERYAEAEAKAIEAIEAAKEENFPADETEKLLADIRSKTE